MEYMEKIEIKDNEKKPLVTPKTITKVEEIKPNFFKENRTLLILGFCSGLVSIGALVFIYFNVFKVPLTPSQIVKLNGEYYESSFVSQNSQISNIPVPIVPKTEVSPLNGTLFTKAEIDKMMKRRPVAVMINNHTEGRPQTGLNQADIVYESVVESGITRYMAIYWSEGAKVVGPIRSARQYYLEWLSPFDALLIHDGCASTKDPRTDACGNIYAYKIKDVSTRGAWRSTDRVAPHNEYTSILSAWDYGEEMKWDAFPTKTEKLNYKRDAPYDLRGSKTKVTVKFRLDIYNYGMYDTQWVYDRNSNSYTHKIGGTTDIDKVTKKPITMKTVIIEEVDLTDAYDGKGRVIIDTIGQGKARFLIDGKIISGKWKKTNRTDRTRYYDNAGKEIEFNRGRIWITVLPKDKGKFDIIEQ